MKNMLPQRAATATLLLTLGWASACGSEGEPANGVESETTSPTTTEPVVPAAGPSTTTDPQPGAAAPSTTAPSEPEPSAPGPGTTNTAPRPAPTATSGAGGDASGGQGGAATSGTAGASGGAGGADTSGTGGASGSSTAGAAPGGTGGTGGVAAGAGGTGTGVGGTPSSGCEDGKVVHFVYFVEADQEYSESQHADIEEQAFTFQQYWYEQLGVTFYLNEPVVDVIEAEEVSTWYLETPDGIHSDSRWYRLGNIKNEVYSKLGIQNFDADHRVVNYPITRHDGRVGGNFGGAWMDGDDLDCMSGAGQSYPYDDGNAAHCLGHPVHEFGHVLGLDHTGPNDDCMQFGFYLGGGEPEMCDFSESNVEIILSDPDNEGWFEALPGETCKGR